MMSSSSKQEAKDERLSQAHNQSHSPQTTKRFQSELAHHEDPYVAGKVSPEERVNVTRAWLKETSRAFDDVPNNFGPLFAFVGAHLNVETSIASSAAQNHVRISASSSGTHNDTAAPITPGNGDGVDDADIEVEVLIAASSPKS